VFACVRILIIQLRSHSVISEVAKFLESNGEKGARTDRRQEGGEVPLI